MIPKTFKKSERLSKKKLIQELFSKGSSFYLYPFKVICLPNSDAEAKNHQVLIAVSKRNHKTAVARNKIKRRIRESYRLNKHLLNTDNDLLIAYIYTSKKVHEFSLIQEKMIKALSKISAEYQSK